MLPLPAIDDPEWMALLQTQLVNWAVGPYADEFDANNTDGTTIYLHTLRCLTEWPRGTGAGELLLTPIIDDTPVNNRGISHKWLDGLQSFLFT